MILFNFTPIQKHMLEKLQTQLINAVLNVGFHDPADDAKAIRQQAYLKGKLELVNELISDEWPDPVKDSQDGNSQS